jgi:hypothetical protein
MTDTSSRAQAKRVDGEAAKHEDIGSRVNDGSGKGRKDRSWPPVVKHTVGARFGSAVRSHNPDLREAIETQT